MQTSARRTPARKGLWAWPVLAAAVLVLAAAGCALLAGLGDYGALSADAGVPEAAAGDVGLRDAPALDVSQPDADAAPEASSRDAPTCDGTWCNCFAANADFCDDFDRPNEVAGTQWNQGPTIGTAAVLTLTPMPASSPPFSMSASNTGMGPAYVAENYVALPGAHALGTFAFDLDMSLGCQSQTLVIILVGTSYDAITLGFDYNGSAQLSVSSGSYCSQQTLPVAAGVLATGDWVRVVLRFGQGASGPMVSLLTGSAGEADGGLVDQVDLVTTGCLTPTVVSLGLQPTALTNPCVGNFDNVVMYH